MFARAHVIATLLFVVGCRDEPPQDLAAREESLARMEAQLARIEARMQTLESTPLTAESLSVELPATPATEPASSIALSVTEREVFINGEAVPADALPTKLKALARASYDASVVVRTDSAVRHDRLSETLSALKKAGFTRIALAEASDD